MQETLTLFLFFFFFHAYVEVRSHHANVSRAIEQQLNKLGAHVHAKFDNEVTHIVFKDGKRSTYDKAMKKKIHIVSVSWMERLVHIYLK